MGGRTGASRLGRETRRHVAAISRLGNRFVTLELPVPARLPMHCHRVALECGNDHFESHLFRAAEQCFTPPKSRRTWGVFAPLNALHSERSRGGGDFGDLAEFLRGVDEQGGRVVGTIPLLPTFHWVPNGLSARHGAYVSYPAEEFYAILSIESHRHRAVIVGENLGTVPREVNRSLKRHAVGGMYAVQYEFRPPPGPVLRAVPIHTVASLNTHDMVPFQVWMQGLDIEDRL